MIPPSLATAASAASKLLDGPNLSTLPASLTDTSEPSDSNLMPLKDMLLFCVAVVIGQS